MDVSQVIPAEWSWLIEELTDQQKRSVLTTLEHGSFDHFHGIDDWIWIAVLWHQTTWVALKQEGEHLLYQCGCKVFHGALPRPCEHVIAAAFYYDQLPPDEREADAAFYSYNQPPLRRLKKSAIAAASIDHEPFTVQDSTGRSVPHVLRPRRPIWKPHIEAIRLLADRRREMTATPRWPVDRQLLYILDSDLTLNAQGVIIETATREPKKTGGWKVPSPFSLSADSLTSLPEADVDPVSVLLSAKPFMSGYGYSYEPVKASKRQLTHQQARRLLPAICRTGRAMFRRVDRATNQQKLLPLNFDEGGVWDLSLDIDRDDQRGQFIVTASLRRGEEMMPIAKPTLLTAGGFALWLDDPAGSIFVAELNDHDAFEWVALLRDRKSLRVPIEQADELLAELYRCRSLPSPKLPQELRVEEIVVAPRPRVTLRQPPKGNTWDYNYGERLLVELAFDYGEVSVKHGEGGAGVYLPVQRQAVRRDTTAENAAMERLHALGARQHVVGYGDGPRELRLPTKSVPALVRTLAAEGWHVEAEGKLYRQAGELAFDVSSGIDWFDLNVTADFGGVKAPFPRLLAALRRGEAMVQLDDGTFGILPEDWLKKYAPLAGVATEQGDALRFTKSQAGLLDALLAAQGRVTFDAGFSRLREELREFDGVRPMQPPATFVGELRPYQCDSLGWFEFLRRFGFGGCLADDMGLGKTVQVLALLEQRRELPDRRPTLVVAPRSLIFNWAQEAARFAPNLRVLDHSHTQRQKDVQRFGDFDLILTTYGTLRRDVVYLKDTDFDYVVLDEAQAIKNAASDSAKSTRLLRGRHRLALSGTPVQNHLGDLWSIFHFLNPGLLGNIAVFAGTTGKTVEPETRQLLSRALRLFILRRTKEQVAQDLPPRQEQTLYCELEGSQRKLYDELREHYRSSLLGLIDRQGINRSKIQILEALLRLRQAACHPALIDKSNANHPSAKLEALIPQLVEIMESGHKALVFSQFTQFLTLVKAELKKRGLAYEYLDGKTKDRQQRVGRFQNDPDCKLFLISLKAGGVGLNLTAADYCFLLDPWWNPAVEAQAIDRAHRIGQTRHVFACRLIAKDTIEEKVLALQQTKRDLADAIINADNALIRTIGRDELQQLLS